jgi:uncharacterized protein
MSKSLSIQEAQKLVLLSQNILTLKEKGTAIDKTLSTIEHLGYIQIDTISAVQRAHHHSWQTGIGIFVYARGIDDFFPEKFP